MNRTKAVIRCSVTLVIVFSMLCCAASAAVPSDTKAPSAPKGLNAANITHTTISLSWTASYDNISVKGYQIYRDGKKIGSSTKTTYTSKNLVPGSTYTYTVKAYDKAGNYSVQSSIISASTLPDNIAPSTPKELKTSSVTVTEANLTWQPASDNVKVTGYDIMRDGVKIGTTSKTSYSNKNLIPGKSYSYTVRAADISDNFSGTSSSLEVTTLKDTQAPTAPSALKVTAVKGSTVSLAWTASSDDSKVAGYQIYCNGIVINTAARTSRSVKSPFGLDSEVFCVKAYDLAGNLSDSSNTVTVYISHE